MNKAVFLDRDGVIIKDKNYISKPEDVELTEKAGIAIKLFNDHGYYTIVVSNQSGISRGYFTLKEYYQVTDKMVNLLKKENAYLDLILFSPYYKDGIVKEYTIDSPCRKPGSGMFLKAKEELSIDFNASWMIGDKETDILAGKNLNMRTILVKTGYGETIEKPDYVCKNLYESAILILEKDSI